MLRLRPTPFLFLLALLQLGLVTGCGSLANVPQGAPVSGPGHKVSVRLLETRLPDLSGEAHAISDSLGQGRSVALVFWQSWCSSCVEEAPLLATAQRQRADRLTVIGVVSGPDKSVNELELGRIARELDLPYASLRDRELALTEGLSVTGTPTIFVIDPAGEIVYRGHQVPADWDAVL